MEETTKPEPQSQPQESSEPQQTPIVTQSPTPISQIPSNPSKIPIRPQKIRKLSSGVDFIEDDGKDGSESKSPVKTDVDSDSSKALTVMQSSTAAVKSRRRNTSQIANLQRVIKPLSATGEIDKALRHLRSSDPLLAQLIDTHPPPTFDQNHPPFLALAKSILYQQLAFKAGSLIYTRFVAQCGGEDAVLPDTVLKISSQQLKQLGVSARKASYLYDLANKYKTGILSDDTIVKLDDRSLFTMLSMVKGIGSWSVHMFMIFSLHRPDVLPVSDLGVRKGVQFLYGLEDLPKPSQMEQLCEKWKPYRSIGAWYMWRFVEGKGASAAGAALALDGSLRPQQQQQQNQQQHQLQLLEPINGIGNYGACIWGQ
jgi:DNA-3-methyladenine glycosylase II